MHDLVLADQDSLDRSEPNDPISAGETASFTITVTNNGPSAGADDFDGTAPAPSAATGRFVYLYEVVNTPPARGR